MDSFPIFISVAGRRVVVVGGGESAARRVRLLLATTAAIVVVAREVDAEIAALARAGRVRHEPHDFSAADLADAALVFAASGDPAVDAEVSGAAQAARVPVNVVDRPALCSFNVPAIVDRDPIMVAIGSDGTAPVLVRGLRARIEALLPARLGALARFAARFRRAVQAVVQGPDARRRFWERFFDGPIAARVLAGDERGAAEAMLSTFNRQGGRAEPGIVTIVGTGPGDPDLLTVRALRLMEQADVVLHDDLVSPEIMARVRRDATRIDVGKRKGRAGIGQEAINDLMVAEARKGRRVLRLKSGDPFVFGRGGEEIEHLRRHGIAAVVVPGITAALGGLAAAGIPLTHRDHAATAVLTTGHRRADRPPVPG
ncbi:MAG: uroporphyrinogen-III C-methyltransferase, partial [Alphaproteobacteria bacterium]|nr:uroporphyrinogen-III C-methyltransferase [Alphaproteobacteria bacterium]